MHCTVASSFGIALCAHRRFFFKFSLHQELSCFTFGPAFHSTPDYWEARKALTNLFFISATHCPLERISYHLYFRICIEALHTPFGSSSATMRCDDPVKILF